MKSKQISQAPEPKQTNSNGKFQTLAYYMAWLGFIGGVALALRDTLKTQELPRKDDYYK
jgi:hypothetical protein